MHRIDTPTAQKDKFGAGKNGFTRGNPQTGTPATDLDDDYCDSIQEELAGLVEGGGLTLDKADRGQVLKALKLLFAGNTDAMGALAALVGAANKLPYFTGPNTASLTDLTSVGRNIIGKTTIDDVLTYLGLGNSATRNVGTTVGTVAAGDDPRIVNAMPNSSPAACTAWVNFTGVSATTILDSYNVSSVAYFAVGKYNVNFSAPLANANYAVGLSGTQPDFAGQGFCLGIRAETDGSGLVKSASQLGVLNQTSGGANQDLNNCSVIIFGGK
ncbi:hypothetical protein ACGCE5_09495 [Kluyvera ascorbata]|uniref:hypothetical protein n=1 Tax=Kluyvera ascorbata TaxID=51288 RepID=UPI00374D8630